MVAEEQPMAVNGRIASCNGGKIPVFFYHLFLFQFIERKEIKKQNDKIFCFMVFHCILLTYIGANSEILNLSLIHI